VFYRNVLVHGLLVRQAGASPNIQQSVRAIAGS
jgi:hypothetical protein